ncbi:hypothetical protein F751_4996 [Auxenochlorella protothecoides]|uniref:Uncharacterized protein n=1 Tax=Auxenochlorella protothecoides TaxID=3075 RepID=A0A087SEK0_AUXPR|nr:hypothetical protein F751_4996 [Auxenochlorella protothecoides]KFM24154.1 hypothetical protein F751_4996 [Auxenochlorella protothecoides]
MAHARAGECSTHILAQVQPSLEQAGGLCDAGETCETWSRRVAQLGGRCR